MDNSEKDIVRRVLESVLDRLGDDASGKAREIPGNQARLSNRSDSSLAENGSPIIFIVVNQETMPGSFKDQSQSPALTNISARPSRLNDHYDETRSPHPGLEKFPIAEGLVEASAPKNCFMEPDRVCVNSGACEMRGY